MPEAWCFDNNEYLMRILIRFFDVVGLVAIVVSPTTSGAYMAGVKVRQNQPAM